MSCEWYLDQISARLDGELTAQEEAQLSAHLCECPDCRAIAEKLKGVRSALTVLEQVQPPEDLSRQVMERVRQEKTGRREAARRRTFRQLAGLAACLLLCVGVYRMERSGMEIGAGTGKENYAAAQFEAEDHVDAADPAYTPEPGVAYATAGDGMQMDGKPMTASKDVQTGTGAQTEPAVPAEEPDHYFFCNDQYIRVSDASGPETPSARILGSVQSLAELISLFPENDLSALAEAYDADYFKTGRLLAVVLVEPSGSNRLQLAPQGLLSDQVTVLRQAPEAGDCDMAAWLILAEVDSMFEEGQQLIVEVENLS